MPAISFSGETSQGAFWKQIIERRKTQTCRLPRVHPLEPKMIVKLYWKQRVPLDKKPIHLIGEAIITKVEKKKCKEFAYDDDFARRDGFRDSAELREWFGDPKYTGRGEEEYDVITFKPVLLRVLEQ